LNVSGVDFSFLIDTGATLSSLGPKYEGPLSSRTTSSVGITGQPFVSHYTPPLSVLCDDLRFSHSFVFMPDCPFNLMGRDLMSRLGITLTFSGSRISVSTGSPSRDLQIANKSYKSFSPAFFSLSPSDSSTIPKPLSSIPRTVWATHKDDVGCVDCKPYEATLKHSTPVYVKQYPLPEHKLRGIDSILTTLLSLGVVVLCQSAYNTPINPVPKPDGSWRFTQDLRRLNDAVVPIAPIVSDVASILSSVPCHHAFFTVIDVSSAFFSIPVEPDTQPIFAFTHRQRQYTWTRLPQGFCDSPAAFAASLRDLLSDLSLPGGAVLLQYADDLLISAPDECTCVDASKLVLTRLADLGFKVSLKKLQFCLPLGVPWLLCLPSPTGGGGAPLRILFENT
uniref:ribonuclease H n=1 Tax=Pygocentrus nattereri TaxID=42514 RepID=A0A3B4CXU0_PYGNA